MQYKRATQAVRELTYPPEPILLNKPFPKSRLGREDDEPAAESEELMEKERLDREAQRAIELKDFVRQTRVVDVERERDDPTAAANRADWQPCWCTVKAERLTKSALSFFFSLSSILFLCLFSV